VSDWPMISLQHEGASRFFIQPVGSAGGARGFNVFLNHLAVVSHFDESGIFDFLAAGVEARGAEQDIKALPLARRLAGIDRWRAAFEIGFGFAATGIDAAAIAVLRL